MNWQKMKNLSMLNFISLILLLFMLLVTMEACAVPPPTSTPSPTPSSSPTPTSTPGPASTPSPTPTPTSGQVPKIAFASDRAGNWEIYTMDIDGQNVKRLTYTSFQEFTVDWSPDGSRLAFQAYIPEKKRHAIYIMKADGSGRRLLSGTVEADDKWPRWSPDGTKIAFSSNRDGNEEIYIMDADGTDQKRLTVNYEAADVRPSWSPDGKKIVYCSEHQGNFQVYEMNIDGTGVTRLTSGFANNRSPTYSPDGKLIAYHSITGPVGYKSISEIYLLNPNTGKRTQLTRFGKAAHNPGWTPDGEKLVFSLGPAEKKSKGEIYIINADGSYPKDLTNNEANDRYPSVQPSR